jgi:hypothetical protein
LRHPCAPGGSTISSVSYAPTLIALAPQHYAEIARAVALLFEVAHAEAFARRVDPGAPETALRRPGNTGVFMGYDFHLGPDGPRLIEVNTNAGGALLNGLHTASRCNPETLGCLCQDLQSVDQIEARLVETFRAELRAAQGADARLARLAIADERPREQFLYPEFELFQALFARHGIEALVADTAELKRRPGGGIEAQGRALDLVYLRDTDFLLEAPRAEALRAAYLAGEVVVTPAPREHHLLANKERLALFSDAAALRALGVGADDAAFLARVVPETRPLAELGAARAWTERRGWVFKPAAGFASRGVYRGDKLTRGKLEEILAAGGYLAQRRIEPGAVTVGTSAGEAEMKFDVRAYAYRDQVLLLGARVYQGQVTNLRTPGGGFSAICVSRKGAA